MIIIDWDSGEGLKIDNEIESVIVEIAAMANKHNDSDDYEMAEQIARAALATALYNPSLLQDILVRLDRQTDEPPKA